MSGRNSVNWKSFLLKWATFSRQLLQAHKNDPSSWIGCRWLIQMTKVHRRKLCSSFEFSSINLFLLCFDLIRRCHGKWNDFFLCWCFLINRLSPLSSYYSRLSRNFFFLLIQFQFFHSRHKGRLTRIWDFLISNNPLSSDWALILL